MVRAMTECDSRVKVSMRMVYLLYVSKGSDGLMAGSRDT